MIYTVECSFADAGSEAEWNDFYSLEKLPALLSVTGFHSSQRFRALGKGYPVYLAVHQIDGLEVLMGEDYRQKGGGNFARWQQHITDWHRNLYDNVDPVPAVEPNELLAVCSHDPTPLIRMGLSPSALHAVALEKSPEHRWLAKLNRQSMALSAQQPDAVHLYAPMTEQLTSLSVLNVLQSR